MLHDTPLIATLTAGLVAAFVAGFIATRLRLPPIVGYLVAGIAIGPFTPGYVGNTELAPQIAEIGVILLMFGVGIHFSVRDLLSVKHIAIPGAVVQIGGATALATALALLWGWTWGEGVVLGLAIGVASTVVLLRALEDRKALTSNEGRIAVGWLVVEDLFTVLALVLLPVMATTLGGTVPASHATDQPVAVALIIAFAKLAALTLVMTFVAARFIPWLLLQVARTGSRELFTLGVLAAALGIAFGSAYAFDVSLALGAFFAGLIVGQSNQSHQAAADALPFRDAFAVLFFVSVGMLFDPSVIRDEPLKLVALVGLVVGGKSLLAFAIVVAFRQGLRTALVVAAALAQVGEFSFILADMGRTLSLVSDEGTNLILGAALVSISINPLLFLTIDPLERWFGWAGRSADLSRPLGLDQGGLHATDGWTVICGGGAVGQLVAGALDHHAIPYAIVERDQHRVDDLVARGMPAIFGDAGNRSVLDHLDLASARLLVVATSEHATNMGIVEHARRANPNIRIVARTRTAAERDAMRHEGVEQIVMSDVELGLTVVRLALVGLGVSYRGSLETLRLMRQEIEHGTPPADMRRALAAATPID